MQKHRANYCDRRRFAIQMAFLAHFNFKVLSLNEALQALYNKYTIPARSLVLTFDDGYDNFADEAWPILSYYHFPVIVYVISNWLGRRADWFEKDPGRIKPTLMNGSRLRALTQAGVTIGSHTMNHYKLIELDFRTQLTELINSKKALEDLLGQPVQHLSYPFGDFNLNTIQAAKEAGYQSATTCLRGSASSIDHPLILPRKAISYGDNLLGYIWKLIGKQTPIAELNNWRNQIKIQSHLY